MRDPDRLLERLNPPQRAAVVHRGGPLLVLAGAGSGKTRVITVRIAHLVATGTDPKRVLALTFTNKAAGEMAERVAALVGEEAAGEITVGTFHSLGLRIVQEEATALGLSRPVTLLDAADQAVAVRQCVSSLGMDPRRHDPRDFLTSISNARNAGETPESLAETPGRKVTSRVFAAYEAWKRAHRVLDFDDLLLRPVELLRGNAAVLERWRARFATLLVDEYQDTNLVQLELCRLLAEGHRSLAVVGDDDQAIYGWRGASADNILGFERHFPDATVVALEQNYRSTGHILGAAHGVIEKNTARKAKRLWTAGAEGDRVRVVRTKDPTAEASFVAAEIHRYREDRGLSWADFGVLFRAKTQARFLEESLRLAGVPYTLVGAYAFYERKEIKDVLAYLRLVANPRDRAAFARVVNFPQRGIGPKRLEALLEMADRQDLGPLEAAARAREVPGIAAKESAALEAFAHAVSRTRALVDARRPLDDAARWLLDEIGARVAWIRDVTEGPGGDLRWKNAERLLESLGRWAARHPGQGFGEFLQAVTLDQQDEDGEKERDAVSLLSIHGAKGLEWPVCFVVGCQEGFLPHQRTIDEGGDIAEERRLFYVAATRARDVLYLTRSLTRRTFQGSEPATASRFLDDVPKEHREDVDRTRGGGETDKEEAKKKFAALLGRVGPK